MTAPMIQGLSHDEVEARRARGQGNNVRLQTSRSYVQILRENVFTFINNVLFFIGVVLILMGSVDNAIITAGLVLLNVIVGVVQEGRAKRKLDHIALLTRPRAAVRRDGQEQTVDPGEIVLGDILVVRPGDQIVADGQVVGDDRMEVDESLLTGESDHVPKAAGDLVYSGSYCVTGSAAYEAQKVGSESFANQLTVQARSFRRIKTPLQLDIDFVVRIMVLIAALLGVLLALAGLIKHITLLEWVQIAAVIVAIVPQGLFFMTTVTYATGALRMAGRGALVQQANAIESMSNVDVLCLDKTGTLTSNRILLEQIEPVGKQPPRDEDVRRWLGDFVASATDRNRTAQAIAEACPGTARPLAGEVPFTSERKWSALRFGDALLGQQGDAANGDRWYVLGAPEILVPCLDAPGDERQHLQDHIDELAGRGRRVLLFAQADARAQEMMPAQAAQRGARPMSGRDSLTGSPQLPSQLQALGVLSFTDELRPEAGRALRGFAEAGISLKIISGDNPETVAALARQAGFGQNPRLISGLELARMDEDEFARAAEQGQIFGRITPRQKEHLVSALCGGGHYVAMIGDGVNDVLSLKQAHLGIAMESGSQAARGVADIVLLGDSFGALPAAFREGQRILRGMQDIVRLFLTRTLYVTMLIVAASMVGLSFPLTPKHNFILALLTVGIPTLFLAAWAKPGQPTYLGHGGRRRPSILLSVRHFVFPAAVTVTMLGLGINVAYLLAGHSPHVARTAMTTALVLCGILLIVFVEPPTPAWAGGDDLSGDRRPSVLALGMLVLLALSFALPRFRHFLDLAALSAADLSLIVLLVAGWAVAQLYIWRHRVFERLLAFGND